MSGLLFAFAGLLVGVVLGAVVGVLGAGNIDYNRVLRAHLRLGLNEEAAHRYTRSLLVDGRLTWAPRCPRCAEDLEP